MRCGLYGKLAIKRDFIAESVPLGFLPAFEPWLQGAVGTSRMTMGVTWQEIYLRAPIWRFWLGTSVCGRAVTGAFMPSIDGVGRFFPLVLMAMADEGQFIAPPSIDPQTAWFDQIEDYLLASLSERLDFAAFVEALAQLPPPQQVALPPLTPGLVTRGDGTLIVSARDGSIDAAFQQLGSAESSGITAAGTFWWTIGGETFPTIALACRGLPDPALFSGFLTGRFDAV